MKKVRTIVLLGIFLGYSGGCTRYVIPPNEKQCQRIAKDNGFIPDADSMLRSMESEFSVYDLKAGEIIADIGAGSGWFEGVCILKYDSLHIDAVDVEAYHVREAKPTIEEFSKLRKTPNSNTVNFLKGKKKSTGLKRAFYHKVIVRHTFHHFDHKTEMLSDIKAILKPGGRLYIYEPISEKSEYFREGKCFHYTREDLLKIFHSNGFKLVSEHKLLGNPGNVPPWIEVRTEDIIPMRIYVFE